MHLTQSTSDMDELIALIAQTFNSTDIFNLKEVGIIAELLAAQNKMHPTTALQAKDGYVGIRSWVLPKLYQRSNARLVRNREDISASTSLLLTTPDNLTAWNVRKAQTTRDNISTELEFSRLMLTRAPKSAESWSHRAWILREHAYPLSAEQLEIELQLAWFAASRCAHNYYAGVHRARLLPLLSESMVERERSKSRKWLQTHVTDASGWWYHRALRNVMPEKKDDVDDAEQQWFHDMHTRYSQSSQNVAVQERLYKT